MTDNLQSPIRRFYAGKNVFITGATGFVGVTIIEKLLRDIPEIGTLYILMRAKKGKSVEQRVEDVKKNSVFNRFKEMKLEDRFAKIKPVEGDVGQENLGLSAADRQLLIDNVNVVIHSAATLDFFQGLRETTCINLLGTRRVVELCSQIKQLNSLVHVSSAYVNSYLTDVEEKLYPAPDDPEKVIDLVNKSSDSALKEMEPKLLKDHPNTYTFTKHLAEHEVAKAATRFACGIVRPSMITAAWHEPVPGWTISKNGPQGFVMGAAKGVIRRLPLDASVIMDYIPVDVVTNAIITTGYYVDALKVKNGNKPDQLQIFHLTSSTYKPFRFEKLVAQINAGMHEYPLASAVWYPRLQFVKNLTAFRLGAIFFHFIPAIFLDLLTVVTGGRPILLRLHRNVWNSLNTLERFIFTEWHYDNKLAIKLAKSMDPVDKKLFGIDIETLCWEEYFKNMHMGVREYLNKESPKNLEAARKKDKILLGLHVAMQLLVYYGIFKLLVCFGISSPKAALVMPLVYMGFNAL
ncbi:putative fatty acyl-CoA reductase CG8306 [Stomoxys calcitrans]|uniref:putative fatty acyl-CoA reductase CG8306 n=1 Tax=Stomoxys calcitrans TaxID=35570 RepID=UPI0027E38015|nr:putative fatty acyl-CoA reductase CG8306 [Stomoxys calcitrans]